MFVGRDEIDFRRHALALFWASSDPAYVAWFLDHFDVEFVWQEGDAEPVLHGLMPLYHQESVALYRLSEGALAQSSRLGISTPSLIPMGGRGSAFPRDGLPPGGPLPPTETGEGTHLPSARSGEKDHADISSVARARSR